MSLTDKLEEILGNIIIKLCAFLSYNGSKNKSARMVEFQVLFSSVRNKFVKTKTCYKAEMIKWLPVFSVCQELEAGFHIRLKKNLSVDNNHWIDCFLKNVLKMCVITLKVIHPHNHLFKGCSLFHATHHYFFHIVID